jgi:hypothetical protein
MLIANAGAEFASTYYYYTILRMHLAGHEDYKEICEDARLEDRAHWELIVPRIYELGGELPNDLVAFPQPWASGPFIVLLLSSAQCTRDCRQVQHNNEDDPRARRPGRAGIYAGSSFRESQGYCRLARVVGIAALGGACCSMSSINW